MWPAVRDEVDRAVLPRRRGGHRRWARCSTSTRSGSTARTTPAAATSFSQPDWYIGFLEGSLRLFPPWETRAFGYMINNLVYSGVLIPGLIFGGALRRAVDRTPADRRRRPSTTSSTDRATRPAARRLGAAAITFVAVLFLGGSQDVIAGTFNISIETVTTILQVTAVVGPPIAWYVTWHLCRSLRRPPGAGTHRTRRRGRPVIPTAATTAWPRRAS